MAARCGCVGAQASIRARGPATPVSAPFQPAWRRDTGPRVANRIGAQSAASAPQITPVAVSTRRLRRPGGQAVGGEDGGGMDLVGGDQLAAEVSGARRRFSRTASSRPGAHADVEAGVDPARRRPGG
jgi:hypothetical protein